MSDSNVFVAVVMGLEREPDSFNRQSLTVRFENGQSAKLAADSHTETYAAVLDELSRMTLAAYVEADPETQMIKRLLVPLEDSVTNIRPTPLQDIEVELKISNVVHILKRTHPHFERLLKTLRDALEKGIPVWVTDDENEKEIVDVRLPNPQSSAGKEVLPTLPTKLGIRLGAITPARAQELFSLVANFSCDPVTPSPQCIPFLFPGDGCAARAHEMCRLMISAGEQPGKLWIYGGLQLDTPNDPACNLNWGYHVAPTLNVDIGSGNQVQVIDPAIFDRPVSSSIWKSKLGDPDALCVPTDFSPFLHPLVGRDEFDPDFIKTAEWLARFRSKLRIRSLSSGPPPYENCL